MTSNISSQQLKWLQTLWGIFCSQAKLDAKDREARLHWAAETIGRQIGSFRELSASEAATAIDALQKNLPADFIVKRQPSRHLAQAYGTAGRRGFASKEVRMADAATLGLLSKKLEELGWTRERFDAFLRSPKSPVRSGAIRTLAEANRAIWALKNIQRRAKSSASGAEMLKRAG
jgi:hypothetical protein